jgi:DNA-binding transcriptional MerR regulator
MAEAIDSSYLSIGEVLGLLLEDFPDVTISKIRFLESQGLISPERTSSGYRKFYGDDVELLRVILTEQSRNYLPLRVIKDRLKSGEIDPTGEHLRPETDLNGDSSASRPALPADGVPADDEDDDGDRSEVPAASIAAHPTSRVQPSDEAPLSDRAATTRDQPTAPQLLPGVLLDRTELCAMVGVTDTELNELESFGILSPVESGGTTLYDEDAVEIALPASELLRMGVDARHLRNWRTSAERESSLFEQLVTPRFRQRNPEARADALVTLRELDALGGTLRAAMTRQALRRHFDS